MMLYRVLAVVAIALSGSAPAFAAPPVPFEGVSQHIFDRLVHFLKIAQATYAGDSYLWLGPAGRCHKEIIVSFRGTNATINHVFDSNFTLADITGTLPECVGCKTHGGYYLAWLSIMDQVVPLVHKELWAYPDHNLVVTGHSLGASLAAICSAHLLPTIPDITTYTFGEPRSGNLAFASFLDHHFQTCYLETTRYWRTTHTDDGIVPIPALNLSYAHQGLELWSSADPASPSNTWVCPSEGFCAEAAGGTGINAAHITYFNVSSGTCSQDV